MDIRQIVIESILECTYLGLNSSDISDDMNMINDLGFDSIIFIQVIVTIEEKLKVSLSNDVLEIDNIITFYDFYNRVKQCIEQD